MHFASYKHKTKDKLTSSVFALKKVAQPYAISKSTLNGLGSLSYLWEAMCIQS